MVRRLVVVLAVFVLVLGACGSDDGDDGSVEEAAEEEAAEEEAAEEEEAASIDVTVTESGVDGVAEVPAGVVDVTVDDQSGSAGSEVNFTLVAEGTTEEAFKEGLVPVFEGGPFPDFLLSTAGTRGGLVTLDEGEYIAWADLAFDLDRPATPDDIVTAPMTVAAGDDDAELPEADGTIVAEDYRYDIDIPAGGGTINFANIGPDEMHHAILIDFGTNDPAVIEENFPAILQAEGPDDIPEGVDPSQIDFEFAGSSVFGPDLSGTFPAEVAADTTYAAVCFISDRAGGPPHAFAHDMYQVFTVEDA